jgi:hypothetical protein
MRASLCALEILVLYLAVVNLMASVLRHKLNLK